MSDSVQPHRRQPTRLCFSWDSPGKNTGVGCHFLLQCMKVKSESEVAQLGLTLRDPMDCSLYQAPLSTGFSRLEYWSGLPLPAPIFMLIPHYFNYCSFVITFEIRNCETFNLALFQDCFDLFAFILKSCCCCCC